MHIRVQVKSEDAEMAPKVARAHMCLEVACVYCCRYCLDVIFFWRKLCPGQDSPIGFDKK